MVYNGEIYNLENFTELKSKGHTIKTNSDTEVLLKLYQLYGYLKMLSGFKRYVLPCHLG
jgi:asparagine synthase (glutamine-hydrolysing)